MVLCLKTDKKQKLLNFRMSVKYLFLLLFQAFVSVFYPGHQQLPDGDVFSSLIWCTLSVNFSDQKIFSFSSLHCISAHLQTANFYSVFFS